MFKLFDRYVLRSHIAPFMFGFSTVIFLFLMQFMMKFLDKLVGKGIDNWVIFQLILFNISWMVVLAAPMGILFSTLMAFGSLSANHEITIIKASGGSLMRMMLPVIIVGAFFTYGLFWFNDEILPDTNHQAKILMSDISRTKPTYALEQGQFSTEMEGYTIISRYVDSLSGLLRGVTIYDMSGVSSKNIISADSGTLNFSPDYTKMILKLKHGEIHQIVNERVDNYKIIDFEDYEITMNASGFSFQRSELDGSSRGDREMKIADMQKIVDESNKNSKSANDRTQKVLEQHFDYLIGKVKKQEPEKTEAKAQSKLNPLTPVQDMKELYQEANLKDDTSRTAKLNRVTQRLQFMQSSIQSDIFQERDYSFRAVQYQVEIQKKYAIPFACFIFIFVGCPLGVMTRGGNFGVSAAISLGFYIFYWACLIGGEKLADRGFLDPVLSMWAGNIIIGIMGLILTLKANYESLEFLNFTKWFRKA